MYRTFVILRITYPENIQSRFYPQRKLQSGRSCTASHIERICKPNLFKSNITPYVIIILSYKHKMYNGIQNNDKSTLIDKTIIIPIFFNTTKRTGGAHRNYKYLQDTKVLSSKTNLFSERPWNPHLSIEIFWWTFIYFSDCSFTRFL